MSIFRRRLMMGGRKPIEYLEFEDRRVWEICAYRWGYTQNIQEVGGAGGVLDDGIIEGNDDTLVYGDHIFAASYAIGAHGSVPATAARTVQYRVELYPNGSPSAAGAPWEIAAPATATNSALDIVQYGTTMSATTLKNITLENWADASYWASQTDLTYDAEKGCWECIVTVTNACQYLRIGLRAAAGVSVFWKVVSVGITKKPLGITEKQCDEVSSFSSVFQSNTLLASSKDIVHFTGVTGMGRAFTSSSILTLYCPPNLVKTTATWAFELSNNSSHITVFLPQTFKGFGQANQFRYRHVTIICLNPQPEAVTTQNPTSNSYSTILYVPDESVDTYKATNGWKYFTNIVGISTLPDNLASELEWYAQF